MSTIASNGSKLKKRIIIRLVLFIILCFSIVVVSYCKPKIFTDHYGNSSIFLTRLWLLASLLATAILTYSANCETISRALNHCCLEEDRNANITVNTMKCNHLNHLIILFILVCTILTIWKKAPLFFVILFVGPVLVALIMLFDYFVSELHKSLLAETEQLLSKTGDAEKKGKYQRIRVNDEKIYKQTKKVVWQLDLPVMAGVLLTFMIGMIIFPHSINIYINDPYVIGFASGSTTLQLLVGNISFSVIGLLSGS